MVAKQSFLLDGIYVCDSEEERQPQFEQGTEESLPVPLDQTSEMIFLIEEGLELFLQQQVEGNRRNYSCEDDYSDDSSLESRLRESGYERRLRRRRRNRVTRTPISLDEDDSVFFEQDRDVEVDVESAGPAHDDVDDLLDVNSLHNAHKRGVRRRQRRTSIRSSLDASNRSSTPSIYEDDFSIAALAD
jgi:hypothetical protein